MERSQSSESDPTLFPVLFPVHLEYLRVRGVGEELAKKARLSSVTKHQGAQLLGWKSLGCGGLGIPYTPESGKNDHWRIRLDAPIKKPDGKEQRWAAPTGEGSRPYILPFLSFERWSDTSQKRVITEAPIKTLAVYGQLDYLSIGLAGSETGHDKEALARGEERLHPELFNLPWEGHTAVLLLDANRVSKPGVLRGEKRLARCLANAGATVLVAELPPSESGEEWGPDDFLAAKGPEALRKVIEGARPAGEVHHPLKEIALRLKKGEKGKPLSSSYNAALILHLDPRWAGLLAFDEFALRVVTRMPPPWEEEYAPKVESKVGAPWREEDDVRLSIWLEHRWGVKLSPGQSSDVALNAALKNPVHPVKDYLKGLSSDGRNLLDSWLSIYFGAPSTQYTKAIGVKFLVSLVARAMEPGCKADCLPIFEGEQGAKKSQAMRILSRGWFTDRLSDLGNKDAALELQGVWLVELGEFDYLVKYESAALKKFFSRDTDRFRAPYGRRVEDHPRQCIFAGTTNKENYLKDETGARRYWPVKVSTIDLVALERDVDQLWAEAVLRYQQGEHWWLEGDLVELAKTEQDDRYQSHPWEEVLATYLAAPIVSERVPKHVAMKELLEGVLNIEVGKWTQATKNEVSQCLRRLGWVTHRVRVKGQESPLRCYVPR